MKNHIGWSLVAVLLSPAATLAQGNAATSVTLFNSGRVLVRRTLPVQIPQGTSTHSLALGAIDESSLALLDPGVLLTSISSDDAWSEDALLRRNIGHAFDLEQADQSRRKATLLSMDPERWEWADGGVVFGRPGRVIWPKELIPASRIIDLTLAAARARDSLRLMYQTSGGSWNAAYRLYTGSTGHLEAVASISGGILDLADAETQLLAGNIGQRAGPTPAPMAYRSMNALVPRDEVNALQTMSSESVGEAHLYTLPARVTFRPGTELVVPLFDPVPARAERQYTLVGALPYYGGFGQGPDEQPVPIAVSYRLVRKHGTPFGDLPLPAGAVSVFETDRSGRVQLIGEGSIGHTAPGEDVSVDAGAAFDVTAKRVQTAYSTTRSTTAPYSTVALASYRITLQNAKDSAVVVEVREDRGGVWSIVESSVPAENRSSTRVVFPVTVPAKGTATLTYSVRVVW